MIYFFIKKNSDNQREKRSKTLLVAFAFQFFIQLKTLFFFSFFYYYYYWQITKNNNSWHRSPVNPSIHAYSEKCFFFFVVFCCFVDVLRQTSTSLLNSSIINVYENTNTLPFSIVRICYTSPLDALQIIQVIVCATVRFR